MKAIFEIMFVVGGLLLVAAGYPMARRMVPPNGVYGFRVPKTLKPGNERIWYEANAYAGRLLIVCGLMFAVAAVALAIVPGVTPRNYPTAMTVVLVIDLGTMVVLSFRQLAGLK